jgi:hypothetical protein
VLVASRNLKHLLPLHFSETGEQPLESKQVLSFHHYAFNLQGWIIAARMLKGAVDLYHFRVFGRSLQSAFASFLRFRFIKWPHVQMVPPDLARIDELIINAKALYPSVYQTMEQLAREYNGTLPVDQYDVNPMISPEYAIHIFQTLGRKL